MQVKELGYENDYIYQEYNLVHRGSKYSLLIALSPICKRIDS
jgi:hypothetical protein